MNTIQKLTVYLGSSGRCHQIFKYNAAELGTKIGNNNKTLVYGGMDAGLMGIIATNALNAGARVTGIIPKKLKDSERIHPHLSETILVPDLWERKLKMFKRADAIIILPGGYGTIDEALEALYWAHLGAHAKPIIFVNTENYWDDFLSYIRTLPDLSPKHLLVAKDADDVFTQLSTFTPPKITGDPDVLPHFEDDILSHPNEPMIFDTSSIKNSYILATALGLKQLDRHQRAIGLLNSNGQFNSLLKWIDTAQKEHFITDRCKLLFNTANDISTLKGMIAAQKPIHIDLNIEKWGPSETTSHIEIHEKK